jgi:hypothetical protein
MLNRSNCDIDSVVVVVVVVSVYPNLMCKRCYFNCWYRFSDNCFEVNRRVDLV